MWYESLMGKKFVKGARGPDAFDCWGLYRSAHHLRTGLWLPDYPSEGSLEQNCMTFLSVMDQWKHIPQFQVGCAVVFRVNCPMVDHIGMMVEEDRFLHVRQPQEGRPQTFSLTERLSSLLWRKTQNGFFIYE